MALSMLNNLIAPLLNQLCEFYEYQKAGASLEINQVNQRLNELFDEMRNKSRESNELSNQFMQLEKPLIFFTDYFIKEGKFPFSREYEPLALRYNELSGDEKFFDILDSYLADPKADIEIIRAFYTMLMLGFDGIFRRESKEILDRIEICVSRLKLKVNLEKDIENTVEEKTQHDDSNRIFEFFKEKRNILLGLIAVAIFCLILNITSIYHYVSDLKNSINEVVVASSPYSGNDSLYQGNEPVNKNNLEDE